jgi:hypothetical protein
MTGADWITLAVLALAVGGALLYIVKAKKSGKKCIGCPHSGTCGKEKAGGCSCGDKDKNQK